jgi:hypothetical protein
MNKEIEFRRLRWLLSVTELIQKEKELLMIDRLSQLNSEDTTLEFNDNELMRLVDAERKILELSHSYDFSTEPTKEDVIQYLSEMIGLLPYKVYRWKF